MTRGRPTRRARGARPPPYDCFLFISADTPRRVEVDACVDKPEDKEEAGDGAEHNAHHGPRRGAFVKAGIGAGDESRRRLLPSDQSMERSGDGLGWIASDGGFGLSHGMWKGTAWTERRT